MGIMVLVLRYLPQSIDCACQIALAVIGERSHIIHIGSRPIDRRKQTWCAIAVGMVGVRPGAGAR